MSAPILATSASPTGQNRPRGAHSERVRSRAGHPGDRRKMSCAGWRDPGGAGGRPLHVERHNKARVVAATRPANSSRRYRPWLTVCDALRAWLIAGAWMTAGLSRGE
jgi:hypothetical protein